MKKLFFLFLISFLSREAFAQDFLWAKKMGGTEVYDGSYSVAVDALGNVYTTGHFQGTVDFDPGPGVYNLSSLHPQSLDFFVSKLDANGNFVWARSFGSGTTTDNTGWSITTDANNNVYTSGVFMGTIDFDPGPAVYNLTAPIVSGFNSSGLFVLKLDGNGDFLWARATSDPVAWGYTVEVDAAGNCYVTGTVFGNTIDFDPGPGVYNINFTTGYGCYILKLDPNGNFVWAKGYEGSIFFVGYALYLDTGGNIYLGGGFNGTVDFDPGPGVYNLTSLGTYDAFIAKFDANGNFIWANRFGNTSLDFGRGICNDAAGNLYFTGGFNGTVDFDPGAGVYNLTSAGSDDIFLIKLTSNGNFTWAKNYGSTGTDVAFSLLIDAENKINMAGYFSNVIDFDPGPGTYNLSSNGVTDILLARFDTSGNVINAQAFGGPGQDAAYAMALDQSGHVYVSGSFRETADFDPGTGTYNLTSDGGTDIFVLKEEFSTLPVTLLNFTARKNNADAILNWQTSSEVNADKFEIERSDDGLVFKKAGEIKASGYSNTIKKYQFTDPAIGISSQGKNIYYRLKQIDIDRNFMYSDIRSLKFEIQPVFSVYPNPAKDFINIETNTSLAGTPFFIADVTGKKIISGNLSNHVTKIDISVLAAGIYFINFEKNKCSVMLVKK